MVPPRVASLKNARAVVEEGGGTVWGKLPEIPYKSDKFGLGFTSQAQRVVRRAYGNSARPYSALTTMEFTKTKSTLWKTPIVTVT